MALNFHQTNMQLEEQLLAHFDICMPLKDSFLNTCDLSVIHLKKLTSLFSIEYIN
jgi:hypothetical protein